MKTLIATLAILASTQTFAFFDDSNASGSFVNNGQADAFGDAKGAGEATFSMNFSARANGDADIRGGADMNNNVYGYSQPYYGAAPYHYQAK
jgi:hypothetical protein